jgi:hypothetical protein
MTCLVAAFICVVTRPRRLHQPTGTSCRAPGFVQFRHDALAAATGPVTRAARVPGYRDAGAAWWLESPGSGAGWPDAVHERLQRGPEA